MSTDTKQTYQNEEFDEWAGRSGLIAEEDFLVSNYLQSSKSTLEAGTAGGRILHALKQRGFSDLSGYDFVPEFIEAARRRDVDHTIRFDVQDARSLTYSSNSFDQILYLQQILSTLETAEDRASAIREAARILKPGGVALVSFLCWEVRQASPIFKLYISYLRVNRALRRSASPVQAQPWLYVGKRVRIAGALLDRRPYVYWSRVGEAFEQLRSAGFQVEAMGTGLQIRAGQLVKSPQELSSQPLDGMLYFVCTK